MNMKLKVLCGSLFSMGVYVGLPECLRGPTGVVTEGALLSFGIVKFIASVTVANQGRTKSP